MSDTVPVETPVSSDDESSPPQKKVRLDNDSAAEMVDEGAAESGAAVSAPAGKRGKRDKRSKRRKQRTSTDAAASAATGFAARNATEGGDADMVDAATGDDDNAAEESGYMTKDDFQNALLEKYYRANLFDGEDIKPEERSIASEQEFQQGFMDTLRTRLPNTFRVSENNFEFAQSIRNKIEQVYVPAIEKARVSRELIEAMKEDISNSAGLIRPENPDADTVALEPPRPIEWYPHRLGWHLSASKSMFRKIPELNDLRQYIMALTEYGYISRQEAVSMLPPLFFDIKSSDRILDMCAAPGSKTAQLMEALYNASVRENKPISGFVVANDNDVKRCYLLSSQLQRLGHIIPYTIITNHDATCFPSFYLPTGNGEGEAAMEKVKFDKILCDVMCSGDGTLRKAPDLWKRWRPSIAWSIHNFQIQVTMQALSLLNEGGTIVYSTCSLNPVEDEAVVSEIIRRSNGRLELVDCSQRFPNLKYSKGLSKWMIMDNQGRFYKNAAEAESEQRIKPTMFPPTEQEAASMNLHRCMRILPHKQDTGGFFIAVLRKKSTIDAQEAEQEKREGAQQAADAAEAEKAQSAESGTEEAAAASSTAAPSVKRPYIKHYRGKGMPQEDFLTPEKEVTDLLFNFYKFDEKYVQRDNLFVRQEGVDLGGGKKQKGKNRELSKRIYYMASSIKPIVTLNQTVQRWKMVNVGVRVFEHYPAPWSTSPYRITQEGAEMLHMHITEDRKIYLEKEDFKTFLTASHMSFDRIKDEEARKHVQNMPPGGAVVLLKQSAGTAQPPIPIAAFRTMNNVMRYVKQERIESIISFIDL